MKTGWIDGSKGNALLVLDLNENGKIDSGMELFGEATVMEVDGDYNIFGKYEAGNFAKNGFVALAQYDKNEDGLINKDDEIFDKLRLWLDGKDGTPNGVTDEGELAKLSEYGIVSFDVDKIEEMHEIDEHGNETKLRGAYTYEKDGKQLRSLVFDVYFTFGKKSDSELLYEAHEAMEKDAEKKAAVDAEMQAAYEAKVFNLWAEELAKKAAASE